MKILAFGASNSTTSINKQLASHAASLIEEATVTRHSLLDYTLPLYSPQLEEREGVPEDAQAFYQNIGAHDAIIISLAEHNGSYTAAFKNLLDWTSRIETKLWQQKPTLLLATSPGGRGGATVLAAAETTFPHLGANVVDSFSLPSFNENFSSSEITDADLAAKLRQAVENLISAITS